MAGTIAEHLGNSVYPNLDAVESQLLDHLSPVASQGGVRSYSMTCPACDKPREAYYYPGTSGITCNRKKNCGEFTSIWDAIQQHSGSSNRDILNTLCGAAGVDLPKSDRDNKQEQRTEQSFIQSVKGLLQQELLNHKPAMDYLVVNRKFTKDDIVKLGYGYYPGHKRVRELLSDAGVDITLAEQYHVIPKSNFPNNKRYKLDGRITGQWVHPDSQYFSLWGRAFTQIPDDEKKYHFSTGTDKTRPYGWSGRHIQRPVCVEGVFDADSLKLMGINGCAVGGNTINNNQAAFFAERGVLELFMFIDGDHAGVQGGLDSIMRCESLGTTVFIISTPEGHDDVDAMRAASNQTGIHRLLQSAMLGGEFYAKSLLKEFLTYRDDNKRIAQQMRKAMRIRSILTPASSVAFDNVLLAYGINAFDPSQAALELVARMRTAGVSEDAINRRSHELYGITVLLESMNG